MNKPRFKLHIAQLKLGPSLAAFMVCCREVVRILLLLTILDLAILCQSASAQSYNEAFGLYIKNDFTNAEKVLFAALKNAKIPGEKLKIYKLLGIVQYMRGYKPQSQAAFKRALAINPDLQISEDEALDESVIPFFNQIAAASRKRPVAGATATNKKPNPPAKTPASATNATKALSAGKAARTPTFGKPINGTNIIIESNVKTAKVSVDGILAGNANSVIEVDPGVREITLQAKGYKTRVAKVKALKNRQSRFTLNLEKPQKARPKNPPQAIAASGATDKEKKPRGAKRSGADIVLPGLDKDLFKEEGESALPDDSGGRDLAAEFQYETGTPVQSSGPIPVQPQQTYITQPGQPMQQVAVPGQAGVVAAPVPTTVVVQAPPPIYSQPPMYAPQPYPAYGAPPAQPPAPLPPPPPPPDYYGEPPDSVTGNESSSADETANEPSSSPAKGKKKPSLFVAMLPGGAGQFQNGDSLLGVAFGAAQIAGFYMYYSATQDAARNESQYKKYASEVSADPKNQDADYEAAYLAFKKNSDSQQQTGLMVFAGSYVASVAQAIFSMPSDTPPRKKKRRRYSLELSPESTEHYALDLKPGESIDFISLSPSTRVHQRSWHAQFLVTASPKRPLFGPGAKQGDDVGYGILLEYRF